MENKETSNGETVKIDIKLGGKSIPLSLSLDSTISELKSLLKSSTNVLPRGQKLIHKGKVLVDSNTLRASNITNGSKIMLMASQGLHQGEGPKINDAPIVANYRKFVDDRKTGVRVPISQEHSLTKTRVQRWKTTGVVGLSELNLKAIPDDVWDCGENARILDLSKNYICGITVKIGCLKAIQKLILSANELSDDSISWEGLSQLKNITYISLNQNNLTYLPSTLGSLTSLEQLHVASNKLERLPEEISLLTKLEIFKVNNNRISAIPTCIGECSALIEVDLSSNLLAELPETFGNLRNLKALHLSNNGLKSLPSTLFKQCAKLSTLDLHGTEVTMDMLREVEGWENFDERRRLKYQKQLDFRAGGSAEFDEGADKS